MNKMWVLPVITLITVVGLFYGGHALLPEEVSAGDNGVINMPGYGHSGSSGGSNSFNFLFIQQIIVASFNYLNVNFVAMENNVYHDSANENALNDSDSGNDTISESEAKKIAEDAVSNSSLEASSASLNDDVWTVSIVNETNDVVKEVQINATTGDVITINDIASDDQDDSDDSDNDDSSSDDYDSDYYSSSSSDDYDNYDDYDDYDYDYDDDYDYGYDEDDYSYDDD